MKLIENKKIFARKKIHKAHVPWSTCAKKNASNMVRYAGNLRPSPFQ